LTAFFASPLDEKTKNKSNDTKAKNNTKEQNPQKQALILRPPSSFAFTFTVPPFPNAHLNAQPSQQTNAGKRYKPVDRKVRPVPATFPEDARVDRHFPEDPLLTLPPLATHPPDFQPTTTLTAGRLEYLRINSDGFLWPEEENLIIMAFTNNRKVLAFNESERGTLRPDYFSDYIIPVVAHEPWADHKIPIPQGIREKVTETIRNKVNNGVYEPSQGSYRSSWFCVPKKNGELRPVINLQKLNGITIKDSGLPPIIDTILEPFAASSIYTKLDLLSGYDARILHPNSRDLTAFHTPLGLLRLTRLPQGFTNSVAEFQNCITFILQDEIPHNVGVMIDDIGIKGPPTRYEDDQGNYETIPENPSIRRFVWEHAVTLNRILHRLAHAGATVSPEKCDVARPQISFVGQTLTYDGRLPDMSRISKILNWPTPTTVTEVRGFLGLCGTVRIWIKGYTHIARPLTELTRKDTPFVWDDRCEQAMKELKQRITAAPVLRPIDYHSSNPVILSVDSSKTAVGFILSQLDDQGHRRPARYGSLPMNERESRYSQAKLELFGLYRALRHYRLYLIGVKNLVVEVDAKYIKGMLNHPDLQPNAAINRWIGGILLFDFTLVHVPASQHQGPDALSRRPRVEGDTDPSDEEEEDDQDWLKKSYHIKAVIDWTNPRIYNPRDGWPTRPVYSIRLTTEVLHQIHQFLTTLTLPLFASIKEKKRFIRQAKTYYVQDDKLWKTHSDHPPRQVILDADHRQHLLQQAHDELGHRGVYATAKTISLRFWWPTYFADVEEFVRTCHECQIRSTKKIHIPPTISTPATLFSKIYLDVMHMPKKQGYQYIVTARDDLSGAAEGCKLRNATAQAVANFLFEEIFCRYGTVAEIVTDNGSETKGAVAELLRRHGIPQIHISTYNSQANGVVERGHFTIREAIVKACQGKIAKWPDYVHHAFFADRVTVRRATGFSPFYLLYGIDPVLPLNLTEATYLVSGFRKHMPTEDLLALRILQLAKRLEDVAKAKEILHQSRLRSKQAFEQRYHNRLQRDTYLHGELVLVRNTRIEKELDRKSKPRYIGPYEVVRQTSGGSYVLRELDGASSRRGVAAFRLLPYYTQAGRPLPPAEIGLIDGPAAVEHEEEPAEEEPKEEDEEEEDDEEVTGDSHNLRDGWMSD